MAKVVSSATNRGSSPTTQFASTKNSVVEVQKRVLQDITSEDPRIIVNATSTGFSLKLSDADGLVDTIRPSGDPSGVTDWTNIQSAWSAGRVAKCLGYSSFIVNQPLVAVSGSKLIGVGGPAKIVRATSWVPNVDQADVDTNAVIKAESLVGSLIGTLQASVRQRKRVIRANVQPANGSWLRLRSTTGQSGYGGIDYGADVVGFEVVQVVSSVSAGGGNFDITLAQPLQQSHGSGTQVHAIVTMVEDVEIDNIHLDFAGSALAVGILARGVRGLRLNTKAGGFSKSEVLVCEGSREVTIRHHSFKGSNAAVFLRSSSGKVSVTTEERGLRVHANGIPRGMITTRHACPYVEIHDTQLLGGTCGISAWGGSQLRIRDTEIRNMDFTDRAARDPEVVAITGHGQVGGSGLELGAFDSPSAYGEFGVAVSIQNVKLSDCGGPNSSFLNPAAWMVDIYGLWIDGLEIINTGAGSGTEGPTYLGGLTLYDVFDFSTGAIRFFGMEQPVVLRGTVRGRFDQIVIWPADAFTGETTAFLVNALVGEDSGGQPSDVRFGTVTIASQDGNPFYRDPVSIPAEGSWRCISIEKFIWGHNIAGRGEWDNVVFANNDTGVTILSGEVVELDQGTVGGVPSLSMSNPADEVPDDKGVLVTGVFTPGVTANTRQCATATWGAVSLGPVMSVKTSATPSFGDRLKQAAPPSRDLVVDSAGAFGVVQQTKNAQGLCRVKR